MEQLEPLVYFIKDNPWIVAFVSVVTVGSAILAIVFYYKQKRVKKLSYLVQNFNVISDKQSKIEDLGVTFKGKQVRNLSVAKFGLWNDGTDTIDRSNIVKKNKLKITAAEGVQILDFQILQHSDTSNDILLKKVANEEAINISFDYLDPDDNIIIQLYHTGSKGADIGLSGKIKGGEALNRVYEFFQSGGKEGEEILSSRPRTIIYFLLVLIGYFVSIGMLIRNIIITFSGYSVITVILLLVPIGFLIWVTTFTTKLLKKRLPKGFYTIFHDN